MILVHTSVWIDHFRKSEPVLIAALEAGQALIYPFVIGDLCLRRVPSRQLVLEAWDYARP